MGGGITFLSPAATVVILPMFSTYPPAIQSIGNQHPAGSRVHYFAHPQSQAQHKQVSMEIISLCSFPCQPPQWMFSAYFNDTMGDMCRKISPLRYFSFTSCNSLWYFPQSRPKRPLYRALATSIQLGAGWWLRHSSNMACLHCVSSEYFVLISLRIE